MLRRMKDENVFEKLTKNLPVFPPLSDFPTDVLKWMKENPKPRMALKLMQVCKYFQHHKFPYFVVKSINGSNAGWGFQIFGLSYQKFDLKSISKLLWITENLQLMEKNDLILTLLPKIAICDVKNLNLSNQNITLEQFIMLTDAGTITTFTLYSTVIKEENDKEVPLENIFKCLPKLSWIRLRENSNTIHSYQEAKKFLPAKMILFEILEIDERFKLEECFKFIENNKKIRFSLHLFNIQSVDFKQKLQTLTDDLIKNWSIEFRAPNINFEGQTTESKVKLMELEEQHHYRMRP